MPDVNRRQVGESFVTARFGVFTLDSGRRQLSRDGGDLLHLTPKAFDLLALLIGEAPRVVRKAELHKRLWPGTFVSDATLAGLVKELRRALQSGGTTGLLIRTSHGVGYAFCGALETRSLPQPTVTHWVIARDRRIPLKEGVNLIGRDPASDVWLDAAGISRRHAQIVIKGTVTQLEDLGSKNGTMLRDVALAGPAILRDGDNIRVGPITIVYRGAESGMSTETTVRG
jgi:DNA-binding winged helix-turn-helix (wHTH) protein